MQHLLDLRVLADLLDLARVARAALDAKKSHGGKDVSDHSEHTKVDHAHGPETSATQQMFRRKSGG